MNRGTFLYSLLGLISLTGGIVALGDKSGGLSVMEGCVCQGRCSRDLASGGVGRSLELDLWSVGQGKSVVEFGGIVLNVESLPSVGEVLQRFLTFEKDMLRFFSNLIFDYMDQVYHSGKSTFTCLSFHDLVIATWGNRLLTKGVLLWTRLIAIFIALLAFPWSLLNQVIYFSLALSQMNPLRLAIFIPFGLHWTAWFCSHLLDSAFRQCILVCNMYLWKRSFFLFGYYALLTGGFTYLGELFSCLVLWFMTSAFFSYLNFEDFYCYENRFLSGEESLEARVRTAVMHGNLHLLDGYLPYSMSYSYRGNYVEYLFKSLWRGKDKLTKSVTFRIPYQEDFSLGQDASISASDDAKVEDDSRPQKKKKRSGGLSKSAIIAGSMHRITMSNEKELRNFARTWSYCCFIKAHAQAKCDPVPRQFYVGQSVYNAFMDQRGEHVDYFEDVATLMASLVFAAQHTDTLAKSSSVTLAINNFRKSKLGTRISNGLAQTQLDLSEMLESSEIGEQINDFVEHISNITSNAKRTLKKFGATGFESSVEVGRLGLKMATMLMASESTSVFRQKVERREETKRYQEKMMASAAKSSVHHAMAEETERKRVRSELASAPTEFEGTWAEVPMNKDLATPQAGFIDSIEALRNVMSMGRESMQTITSGKVVKLIASLLALGTIIRTGSFYLANYEEIVSHIRAHPVSKSLNLMEALCESCQWLTTMGQEIACGGNPFLIPSAIKQWESTSLELLLHKPFVGNDQFRDKFGAILDPMVLRQQLADKITDFSRLSVQIATITSSKDAMRNYKNIYDQLRTFLAELRMRDDTGSTRIPPLGILLHGLPGIGKTTLINGIFSWLSMADGMEFNKNAVFRRPPGSRFWSNFNSEKLWLILDDVATFRPQSKKVDESLSDIIHVLNSSPFNPDMNQNDEKGKFVCNIRAVCATTNKLDMDVAVDFNSPDAIFRRFQYHLTVELKQGRFNQNGKLVTGNMTKADYRALGPHSSDLYPDFWIFRKHAYVNGRLQIVSTFNSFHDLMVDMARVYKRHREHEGKIMERETAYSKETLCPRSKVPSSICNCTNCPKGRSTHALTVFQRLFRSRAAQKAAKNDSAVQIQRISRGFIARMRATRLARAVVAAGAVPSGACFSILRKAKPVVVPRFWFTWVQLIHWLCIIVIIGCACYIVWKVLTAIYRGIKRDIQHYTDQLVARHLPEVSNSLNAAVRQEVEQQVGHYYPAVLLELKTLVDAELAVLRNWLMVGATAVMSEWSLRTMMHGLFVHSYTAALSLGVAVYHYSNQANRALGLYNLGQSIRRHLTFRNAVLLVLISSVTLLLASYAMGQKKAKTSLPGVIAEPQVGRPVPVPGPGGSEAPRNVWFSSSDIMNTFGNGTLCSRGGSCDAAVNSLLNNIVSLVLTVNGETSSTHGYLVGGQFVLATAHSFTAIRNKHPTSPVTMHIGFPFNSSGCVVSRLEYRRMVVHAQNDLALIHVPELPSRTDKYDYFIEANHDWSTFAGASFVLPSTEATGAAILHNVTTDYSWLFSGGQTISGKITIPTVAGDCGRPLLAISKEHGVCILGLHHAALIADPLSVASAFVSRTWLMRSRDELVRKLELPLNIAVAQSAITASPICFGDINQVEEALYDKQGRPIVLEQMSAKCALHERFKGKDEQYHIEDTNIFYFGKISKLGSRKMKSSVTSTPFRDLFESAGFVCRKEAPKFDWKSKVLHARNISRTSNMIDDSVLSEVVQVYTRQLLETLPTSEHNLFEVYDLHTALNGADGVAYVDRVKVNTSAGYPFFAAKRELLYTDYDGVTLTYTLQPQFEAELYRYYDMMRSGNRPRLLFSANMKDEAISPEKNQTRGPRLFMAGNVYSILIGRMLFLSYIRVVQRNPFIFFSAPGMNAFSRIWLKLYQFITKFGLYTILAGDYKNFDQKMAPKILEAAYSVIIGVMTSKRDGFSKFSDEDRLAAKVWASTCAFPECEVDGDVYQLCGSNPSGNTMTVHTNCTVNVIYIMYAWRLTGHKLEIFFLRVVIMTYGDDNMVGVCETVKVTFNYSTIYPALLEIGVEYTPADKSSPTAKMFDDLKDLQFLKRGFVMRMGRMFCPIDVATIHKLGILWVKSTLSTRDHGLAVLKDIWRESAIHGGDIQKANQELVTRVLKDYYNMDTSVGGFLSDEEFLEQYDSNSTRYEMFSTKGAGALVPIATAQHLTIQLLNGDAHTVETRGCGEELPGANLQSTNLVQSGILQCGTTEGAWSSPSSTKTTAANTNLITFDDESPEQVADMPLVPVQSVEHIQNPVSEWLMRPVLIHENEWEEQGTVDFVIAPLQLFLAKTRIWEKLRGFSKLHANLHIKIVLNASQFHYGALLASWFPMGVDETPYECFSAAYTSQISGDAYGELMMESIRPHIMLFPQDNSSGELYLPYFYPKDWWDLESSAANSIDLERFGSLRVRSMTPLKVAQAVTGNKCTISIFAWLSEPSLAAPSLALAVAQSGKMMDLSKATKELSDMPVLGAAFDVTSKLAKVTAAVMKLAGYSNPIDTSTVATTHLSAMPHVSSTEISVASSHLGVSKASGLSLSICGSSADELILADIAKKDCFIGVYPWTNGNSPGTEIFATYVTPEIYRQKLLQYKVSTEEYAAVYQSPSSYVAQMFGYWRGTMVYTIRVIASQFHSGRVRVYYDASQPVPSNPEECALYSEILDISTEKELEIRVPWNASLPYCMVSGKPLIVDADVCWTKPDTLLFGGATYDRNLHNGSLSIQVLNKLMGPVVSSVYLMVSARLEDAKFANPVQIGSQNTGYTGIPSDLEMYRPVSTFPMALAQSKFETTPASTGNVDDSEIVGEVITSARELLHRANRYADIVQDPKIDGVTIGLNSVGIVSFPRIPVEPGQPCVDAAGIGSYPIELTNSASRTYFHNCKVSVPQAVYRGYNFLKISPYQYLRGAFVGERGSHVYKLLMPSGQLGLTTGVGMASVHRRSMQTTLQEGYTDAQSVGLSVAARHQVTLEPSSAEGLTVNTCSFDNSLMVSAPMYSRFKFLPTNPARSELTYSTMGARNITDVLDDNLTLVTKANVGSASTSQALVVASYHSVGVDFNFVGFVNPPVLFVAKTWPAV